MDDGKFDSWAIVEVMGHKRFSGHVTERSIGGTSFVRVDVPETKRGPAFTKLLGAGSIYCISPVSEEIARADAETNYSHPLQELNLPDEMRTAMREGRKLIGVKQTEERTESELPWRGDEYDDDDV